ncbi:MAG: hypothetical protein ACRERD_18550, partial [Candidatus Binatia bacterium]
QERKHLKVFVKTRDKGLTHANPFVPQPVPHVYWSPATRTRLFLGGTAQLQRFSLGCVLSCIAVRTERSRTSGGVEGGPTTSLRYAQAERRMSLGAYNCKPL